LCGIREISGRKDCSSLHIMPNFKVRLEQERRWKRGLEGRVHTPFLYLCPQVFCPFTHFSEVLYLLHISLSFKSFYTFLCPLTLMAILTKSRTLFIFIHPKIGIIIIYTQIRVLNKFSFETQTPLTTSYFVIALYMLDECPPLCFCTLYCKVLSIQPHLFASSLF